METHVNKQPRVNKNRHKTQQACQNKAPSEIKVSVNRS